MWPNPLRIQHDMPCESCQKNEATCHINKVKDGVVLSRNLCSRCHEADSPDAKELNAAPREARYEYCGAQPCTGGTDIFAMVMGIQKLKFMCMRCSMEYYHFIQEPLQRQASG